MEFEWKCQPQAENLLLKHLDGFTRGSPELAALDQALTSQASSRLFDFLDHLVILDSHDHREELQACGFEEDQGGWHHPGALLPRIRLGSDQGAAVRVDFIENFLCVRGMNAEIEGTVLSPYRRAEVWNENGISTWAVERRSSWTMVPTETSPQEVLDYHTALEMWKGRRRDGAPDEELMQEALRVAKQLVDLVGQDMAAWIVHEGERHYWESRNRAAEIQKNRQDRLGMGWANQDHHTYRSSRKLFNQLIEFHKTLGFHCRERFYAGEEAGWGAQVMENPNANLTLFLDVDLFPEEVLIDFSATALPDHEHLGTIGLWCALHGDSVLKAGMHHLEAQFNFDDLRADLDQEGIGMMQPFSNFSYLKQAFTKGEQWQVAPHRVQALVDNRKISQEQANKFLKEGAIGSHLENLQRREGYKGFNQKNVSFIIGKTDPRKQSETP